jgi:hypothetical protein
MSLNADHFCQNYRTKSILVIVDSIDGQADGGQGVFDLIGIEITIGEKLTKPAIRDEHEWPGL